jgi:hypothetical protein
LKTGKNRINSECIVVNLNFLFLFFHILISLVMSYGVDYIDSTHKRNETDNRQRLLSSLPGGENLSLFPSPSLLFIIVSKIQPSPSPPLVRFSPVGPRHEHVKYNTAEPAITIVFCCCTTYYLQESYCNMRRLSQ